METKAHKKAIIIGAGPAGLTAAYELLKKTDIKPHVYEMSADIGGLSKTIRYKGNRLDIGGHRFFSRSSRVMEWWQNIMPLQEKPALDDKLLGREISLSENKTGADPEKMDLVMLIRRRISRYFFQRSFFDYPVSLTYKSVKKLGWTRIIKIGMSYFRVKLFPVKDETTLEDFLINRFGRELYKFFFKDYTEKVWGVACNQIPAIWGVQRIKGLSITKTLIHALRQQTGNDRSIAQKNIETSLIEQFLYPKFGPGQLWEEVARQVLDLGGKIYMNHQVVGLNLDSNNVTSVNILNKTTEETLSAECDYLFSTMPVKDFFAGIPDAHVPGHVSEIAKGLLYRDFITIGLLLKKLKIKNETKTRTINNIVPDNWIYIQEKDIRLGRLQIYNNWSPYMVRDLNHVWIGVEYFCNEGDQLWSKKDYEIIKFAINELVTINFIEPEDVLDATIIRELKTYPAYFGTYEKFDVLRKFTDNITNLFLIGRNGMHRYNNMDHSMMTAMVAVENIVNGIDEKENIWQVNTEKNYHEEL